MKSQTIKLTISTFAIATILAWQMSTTTLVASEGTSGGCPQDKLEKIVVTVALESPKNPVQNGDITTVTIEGEVTCTAHIKRATTANIDQVPVSATSAEWSKGAEGENAGVSSFTGGKTSCSGVWKKKTSTSATANVSITANYSCSAGSDDDSASDTELY